MKKLVFFFLSFLFFSFATQSQIRFGLRAGLSTDQLDKETVQSNGLSIAIKDANYGFHFGAFGRIKISERVFLQPEALFNSNSVDFQVTHLSDGLVDKVLNEKYQSLDLPLMAGLKFGPLRLQAGPVGHVHIASKSELEQIDGFQSKFNNFQLGYQAGVGLDIWKLLFDLKYEGNFTRFGEHITVGGEDIKFSQNPNRWVASVGFSF